MTKPAAKPDAMSPLLRRSSEYMTRVWALYRETRRTSTAPNGWIDDALYAWCSKQVREQMEKENS